jgi:hypothetical protein
MLGKRGDGLGEPVGIDRGGIEFVFVDPTYELVMALVLGSFIASRNSA